MNSTVSASTSFEPSTYRVPESEISSRLTRTRAAMRAADLDALIVAQNADLHYFTGTIPAGSLVITHDHDPVLAVARARDRSAAESPIDDVRRAPSTRELCDIVRECGARRGRIGIELDVLPAATYLKLTDLLPAAQFVDATPIIRSVRAIKSEWELGWVHAAAAQVKSAMASVMPQVRIGMTELEVARTVEFELRAAGHQGTMRMRRFNGEMFFGQICAGDNAALPAALDAPLGGSGQYPSVGKGASARVLMPGDLLVFDLMGAANGYLSDCTRVLAIGGRDAVDDDLLAAQDWCTNLLAELVAMAVPGARASALHEHALERAAADDHADRFMGVAPDQARFVGHGIGLEVDEYPFLARGYETPLQPGMVVAIEPKLVFPGRAAVGIEDAVIISDDGAPVVLDAVSREVYDVTE